MENFNIDTSIPLPINRTLFFNEQVDQFTIGNLIEQIININENDEYLIKLYKINNIVYEPQPIKIYIDSYGGNVYQILGLISVIRNSKTLIHTICTGVAMSCGFMLLISGHIRSCYKLSTPMYHQVSSGADGEIKYLEDDLKESKRLQKIFEGIVLSYTKITDKQLKNIYSKKKDWYMSAEEAKELRVVDNII